MLLNPLPNEQRTFLSDTSDKENEFPLEHQKLFNWVNTLPYKNCSLVSEIDDFRNGLAFSEILCEILQNREFLPKIESSNLNYSNCIQNLEVILNETQKYIQVPEYISNLTGAELFENDQKLIILLAFLYNERQNPNKLESYRTKIDSNSKRGRISAGKPPLGPTSSTSTLQNIYNKPQIFQSDSKKTDDSMQKQTKITNFNNNSNSRGYQIIQPPVDFREFKSDKKPEFAKIAEITENIRNILPKPEIPTQKPQRNIAKIIKSNEKIDKNEKISEKFEKSEKNEKIEKISEKTQISEILKNSIKPSNFQHFNQISELSDPKFSPLPYLTDTFSGNPSRPSFPLNLSIKFEETLESPSKPPFSTIFFNPKPGLNKFNEKVNTSHISEDKIIDVSPTKANKVNLTSILKKSKEKTRSFDYPEVIPLKQTVKTKLFQWLIEINLIKANIKGLQERLFKICKNGVIFADIINRLESRQKSDVLKGITRKPKKPAEIHANYTKIFDYFKDLEKMNKRYLYCYDQFQDNEDVFWGFLDDVWHFFHQKVSTADSRYQEQRAKSIRPSSMYHNESFNKRFYNSSKKSEIFSNASYDEICQGESRNFLSWQSGKGTFNKEKRGGSFLEGEESNIRNYESIRNANINKNEDVDIEKKYEVQAWKLPQKNEDPGENQQKKEKNNSEKQKNISDKEKVSAGFKKEIHEWLKQLGYNSYLSKISSQNPTEDPLRNGVLYGLLLSRLHLSRPEINKSPKSLVDCKKNLDMILQVIKKLQVSLPFSSLRHIDSNELLKGNEFLIYQILFFLKKAEQKDPSIITTRFSTRNSRSMTLRSNSPLQRSLSRTDSSRLLIKTNDGVSASEKKIFEWIKSMGLFPQSQNYIEDFNDIFPLLTNGVLFCDLAEKLCEKTISAVNRKPLSEKAKRGNIEKAIGLLRENRLINLQCSNISIDEIFQGNYLFILELLEMLYHNRVIKSPNMIKNESKIIFKEKNELDEAIAIGNIGGQDHELEKEEMKNSELLKTAGILKNKFWKAPETVNNSGGYASKTIKIREIKEDISGKDNINTQQKKCLDFWLKKLGFEGLIEYLDPNKEILEEFKDGLIYCKIMEKLENREILGINYKPRSSAACKSNIKRVLELLRGRKDMNLKYLYDEDTLYESISHNIIEFLSHIKYAYRLTFKYYCNKNIK